MERYYFKYNADDVSEIVSEYLAESMKLKNFSARTDSFGSGDNWSMIIAANKKYNSELFKLDLESINTSAEYTGKRCKTGYWKYENLISLFFKWLCSAGNKENRKRAYEDLIKNIRNKHRIYFKLDFNDVSAILLKCLSETAGLKEYSYKIKMYGEGYSYRMLIVIGEKSDIDLNTVNMDEAFENTEYNGTHWDTEKVLK